MMDCLSLQQCSSKKLLHNNSMFRFVMSIYKHPSITIIDIPFALYPSALQRIAILSIANRMWHTVTLSTSPYHLTILDFACRCGAKFSFLPRSLVMHLTKTVDLWYSITMILFTCSFHNPYMSGIPANVVQERIREDV